MSYEDMVPGLGRAILKQLGKLREGETITRQDLIENIFGIIPPDNLIMCREDRTIRQEIGRMQLDGYLIISPRGIPGYKLVTDKKEIAAYVAGLRSRVKALSTKICALERSLINEGQPELLGLAPGENPGIRPRFAGLRR